WRLPHALVENLYLLSLEICGCYISRRNSVLNPACLPPCGTLLHRLDAPHRDAAPATPVASHPRPREAEPAMPDTNHRLLLTARPTGIPGPEDFAADT